MASQRSCGIRCDRKDCFRVTSPLYVPGVFETLEAAVQARREVMCISRSLEVNQLACLESGLFVALARGWKRPRVFLQRSLALEALRGRRAPKAPLLDGP